MVTSLRGYAALARLGHGHERLEALAPEVDGMFQNLRALWQVDVSDVEMAVAFDADRDSAT